MAIINQFNYLKAVETIGTTEGLMKQTNELRLLLKPLTTLELGKTYAPGKWSIAQVIVHLSDCERIMTYRALCFSRGEQIELPAFDEDEYAANSGAARLSKSEILQEFTCVRQATLSLYACLSKEQLSALGRFAGNLRSVEEIFRAVMGHTHHHFRILRERYDL